MIFLPLPLALTLYGLTGMDLLTIVLYFAGMLYIGYWSMKRVRDQEGYFLGGRKFGKPGATVAPFSNRAAVGRRTRSPRRPWHSAAWIIRNLSETLHQN